MKSFFAILALFGAVGWCAPVMAQDKPAAPACRTCRTCAGRSSSCRCAQRHTTPAPTPNKGERRVDADLHRASC